jgi:predicted GH43/DUF377 family glycosyl hydrolase
MRMPDHRFTELFTRHPGNPIIQSKDIPYRASAVFNAGATIVGNETLLLLRIEDRRGISHLTVARSKDGVSAWVIDSEPTLWPSPRSHPEEIWGIEDPRITYLEEVGLWAILYTAYSNSGPLVSLATTRDFKTFDRKGAVMPPEDKDAALFPVRFGDRWAMLHRPVPAFPGTGAHIWISFSPDMYHWGEHRVLIHARKGGMWDAGKIGLSPPPIRTEKGWLVIYHGVKMTAGGCIYRLGLAMLDLENPAKLTHRADEWVFAPEESYELAGDVDKVVFPCGWVVRGDEIRLYYGGADKCIALATGSLREIVGWLTK